MPWLAQDDLARFQHEIHMHSIKWKVDAAIISLLQYTSVQKRVRIAMNRFYIPPQPACCFTNRYWSCAGHGLKQLPTFAREHLEKKCRRLEANECSLRFSLKRSKEPSVHFFSGRDYQCNGTHLKASNCLRPSRNRRAGLGAW